MHYNKLQTVILTYSYERKLPKVKVVLNMVMTWFSAAYTLIM